MINEEGSRGNVVREMAQISFLLGNVLWLLCTTVRKGLLAVSVKSGAQNDHIFMNL